MKYVANPVIVDAYKIIDIRSIDGDLHLDLDNGVVFKVENEMRARMYPVAGDYLVIQEDGYQYLNPRDVFERKYSRVVNDE